MSSPQAGGTRPKMRAEVEVEARDLVNDLREALASHGIVFPSLTVDPLSYVDDEPRKLLSLGRINAETARNLIKALDGIS